MKPRLENDYNEKTIAVFGSVAREEADTPSDIDVLVEFEPSIGLLKFLELGKLLSTGSEARWIWYRERHRNRKSVEPLWLKRCRHEKNLPVAKKNDENRKKDWAESFRNVLAHLHF